MNRTKVGTYLFSVTIFVFALSVIPDIWGNDGFQGCAESSGLSSYLQWQEAFDRCRLSKEVAEPSGSITESIDDDPPILWWYDLDAPSFGSAAVGDIDKDGMLEIVFGTYFNDETIYALNAEDGSLHWKYTTGGCNDASPTIADVDLDGELEVVVPASSPSTVYCFSGSTGVVEWSRYTGYYNCIDSPPAVADVDNDDSLEVVLGTFHGYVFCLNGEDGSVRWQINLGTDSYIQSGPNILDLDGDGDLDVAVAQYAGDCRIYALYGENGSTMWYSDEPQDFLYHGGSFADIDEDGKPEIAIGCYDHHVYVVNAEDGSPVWDYPAPYYIAAPTSIGDLNNDDHLEIVFASYNILGVLSHTGSLLWSYPTYGSIFRGAAIADVDSNGVLDVAFGSSDGILRALKGDDGEEVWIYDLQAHYGRTYDIDHAPVIADFDGDGQLDVFVVGGYGSSSPPDNNHGRAYALSAGNGAGVGWSIFRHDVRHSARYGNGPPAVPARPFGPTVGYPDTVYGFSSTTTDLENDSIYYQFDWSGEVDTLWRGPFNSSDTCFALHAWTQLDTYYVRARAQDIWGFSSDWSDTLIVRILPVGVKDEHLSSVPEEFALFQNHPNPFNPIAEIAYTLPVECRVRLEIYNLLGQKVATLVDERQPAGYGSAYWDASPFASGIYFYRISAGDFVQTRKMVLMQ